MIGGIKVVNNGTKMQDKEQNEKIIKTITIPFILYLLHQIALGKTIKNVILI